MQEKTPVSIVGIEEYDNQQVLDSMRCCLKPFGGMAAFVKKGQKVLLKPNLVSGFPPEKAVTTHPAVLRAAVLLVQEAGGIALVGDSPGIQNPMTAAGKAGWLDVLEETGAQWADFTNTVEYATHENAAVKRITLAKAVSDADVIISLPKLKTHVLMVYTGAVKNQFGLIVGTAKARYHYRLKTHDWLAEFFLDINRIAKPALAIMDGIVGMEGNGPSGGDPRKIGVLMAGTDFTAVDVAASSIINLDPAAIPTIQAAARTGFGVTRLEDITFPLEHWEKFHVPDFRPIKHQRSVLLLPLPGFLQKWLRRRLAPRPRVDQQVCIHCGACRRGCPVDPPAINPDKNKKCVNDDACIRCYCCHEFCPVKAIRLKRF